MNWIIQSERLGFRKLTHDDFESVAQILKNIDVMYAWEHAFSDTEVREWIDKNLYRYEHEGYSYFAVIEKSTKKFIGMMGPLIETINDKEHIGIAYIINNKYWGNGFATEGAKACVHYAFGSLNSLEVIAQIRPENYPSLKVAEKLGMCRVGEFIKHYNGKDMPHLVYSIDKNSWENVD